MGAAESREAALRRCARDGDSTRVRYLLKQLAKKHANDPSASPSSSKDSADLNLLQMNIDAIDTSGRTALFFAASNGHSEICKMLTKAGAYVNLPTGESGATACFAAANHGHGSALRALLRSGADPKITTAKGISPLQIASLKGHLEIVKELLRGRQINVDHRAKDGATAVYLAAQNGHEQVVRLLGDKADVNIVTSSQTSPMFVAAARGHLAVVLELLNANANVNLVRENGATALHAAAYEGHPSIVRVLLEAGADPLKAMTGPDAGMGVHASGATPLDCADLGGNRDCIRLISLKIGQRSKIRSIRSNAHNALLTASGAAQTMGKRALTPDEVVLDDINDTFDDQETMAALAEAEMVAARVAAVASVMSAAQDHGVSESAQASALLPSVRDLDISSASLGATDKVQSPRKLSNGSNTVASAVAIAATAAGEATPGASTAVSSSLASSSASNPDDLPMIPHPRRSLWTEPIAEMGSHDTIGDISTSASYRIRLNRRRGSASSTSPASSIDGRPISTLSQAHSATPPPRPSSAGAHLHATRTQSDSGITGATTESAQRRRRHSVAMASSGFYHLAQDPTTRPLFYVSQAYPPVRTAPPAAIIPKHTTGSRASSATDSRASTADATTAIATTSSVAKPAPLQSSVDTDKDNQSAGTGTATTTTAVSSLASGSVVTDTTSSSTTKRRRRILPPLPSNAAAKKKNSQAPSSPPHLSSSVDLPAPTPTRLAPPSVTLEVTTTTTPPPASTVPAPLNHLNNFNFTDDSQASLLLSPTSTRAAFELTRTDDNRTTKPCLASKKSSLFSSFSSTSTVVRKGTFQPVAYIQVPAPDDDTDDLEEQEEDTYLPNASVLSSSSIRAPPAAFADSAAATTSTSKTPTTTTTTTTTTDFATAIDLDDENEDDAFLTDYLRGAGAGELESSSSDDDSGDDYDDDDYDYYTSEGVPRGAVPRERSTARVRATGGSGSLGETFNANALSATWVQSQFNDIVCAVCQKECGDSIGLTCGHSVCFECFSTQLSPAAAASGRACTFSCPIDGILLPPDVNVLEIISIIQTDPALSTRLLGQPQPIKNTPSKPTAKPTTSTTALSPLEERHSLASAKAAATSTIATTCVESSASPPSSIVLLAQAGLMYNPETTANSNTLASPPPTHKAPSNGLVLNASPQLRRKLRSPLTARLSRPVQYGDIDPDQLIPLHSSDASYLGIGRFGVVHRALWAGTVPVAVKTAVNPQRGRIAEFSAEMEQLRQLQHPNIVLVLGFLERPKSILIVVEYGGRSLWSIVHPSSQSRPTTPLHDQSPSPSRRLPDGRIESPVLTPLRRGVAASADDLLPLERLLALAIGIARGLLYLHERPVPVVHGHLTPTSIYVDEDDNAKIADFGMVQAHSLLTDHHHHHHSSEPSPGAFVGVRAVAHPGTTSTVNWASPECLGGAHDDDGDDDNDDTHEPIGPLADCFSVGVILWEMSTGQVPFAGLSDLAIVRKVCLDGARVSWSDAHAARVPASLVALSKSLMAELRLLRPSAAVLLAQLELLYETQCQKT